MEHILIYPVDKSEKGLKSVKLSLEDALKLCCADNEKIIFDNSKPFYEADIKDGKVEFISEQEKIVYTLQTVKDIINKYYYIGQKCKKKC